MEIVFNEFQDRFLSFFGGLGGSFSEFFSLENRLENEGFFVIQRILSRGSGGGDPPPIWPIFGSSKDIKA